MDTLPLEEFAESMGLPTVPHVKFVLANKIKQAKNAPHPVVDSDSDEENKPAKKQTVKTKTDRMFNRQNQTILSKHYEELHADGNTAFKLDAEDDDGDIFDRKRKIDWDEVDISTGQLPLSKRQQKIATSRKALAKKSERGTKLKFDDDGVAHPVYDLVTEEEFKKQGNPEDMKRQFVEETAAKLRVVDEDDLEEFKEKRKLKKLKREGRLDAD